MKEISIKALFFVFFCCFASFSFSQEALLTNSTEDTTETIKPIAVSKIKAEPRGNSIYISWTLKYDTKENTLLYRATKPISDLSTATLIAELDSKTLSYYDKADEASYFYAVLAKSEKNNPRFIPLENATAQEVSPGIVQEKAVTKISNLQARAEKDCIKISYDSDILGRKLILYRSIVPLTDSESLAKAVIAGIFINKNESFTDYPLADTPYFYGLVDEEEVRSGTVKFFSGTNTTSESTKIKGDKLTVRATKKPRTLPIPTLSNDNSIYPEYQEISKEAENLVAQKIKDYSQTPTKRPQSYIFKEEFNSKSTGEEYTLKTIIEETFAKNEWNNAEKSLHDFLALHRSEKTVARTNHYLGQVYFFRKNYEKALISFLLARNLYYQKSQEWIQYSLDALIAEE